MKAKTKKKYATELNAIQNKVNQLAAFNSKTQKSADKQTLPEKISLDNTTATESDQGDACQAGIISSDPTPQPSSPPNPQPMPTGPLSNNPNGNSNIINFINKKKTANPNHLGLQNAILQKFKNVNGEEDSQVVVEKEADSVEDKTVDFPVEKIKKLRITKDLLLRAKKALKKPPKINDKSAPSF